MKHCRTARHRIRGSLAVAICALLTSCQWASWWTTPQAQTAMSQSFSQMGQQMHEQQMQANRTHDQLMLQRSQMLLEQSARRTPIKVKHSGRVNVDHSGTVDHRHRGTVWVRR